jgi:WD40 repeat protein
MIHKRIQSGLSRAFPFIGRPLQERNIRLLARQAKEGDADAVRRLIALRMDELETPLQLIVHDALSSLSHPSAIDAFCQCILWNENSVLEEMARNHEYVPSDEGLRMLFLVCTDRWDDSALLSGNSVYALFRRAFIQAPDPVKRRVREKIRIRGWTHLLYYDLLVTPMESAKPDLSVQDWNVLIRELIDTGRNVDLWSLLFCAPPSQSYRILKELQKQGWNPPSPTDRLLWNDILKCQHPLSTFRPPVMTFWRENPFGEITCLSELVGENMLVSGNGHGSIAYWTLPEGNFLTGLPLHATRVVCISSSPDGVMLASGDHAGTVQLSRSADGVILGSWSCRTEIRFLRFTPDVKYLLIVDKDGWIYVWDIQNRAILERFDTQQERLSWFEIVERREKTGYYLIVGYDTGIHLFEVPGGVRKASLSFRTRRSTSFYLSSDGAILFVGFSDSTIRLYRIPDLSSNTAVLKGLGAEITALAETSGGTILASGSLDGIICIWDMPAGSLREAIRTHAGAIYQLKGLIQSPKLVSGSDDGIIRVWHLPDGSPSGTIQDPAYRIRSFMVSSDESLLVTQGTNHNTRLWSLVDFRPYGTLRNLPETVSALAIQPDGEYLVSSGGDRILYIRNLKDGHLVRTIPTDTGRIACLTFLPEGRHLAYGGDDRMIHLLDLQTGDRLTTLQGSKGTIFALAVNPQGTKVAGAGWDEIVRVWNRADGSLVLEMKGHSSVIRGLCFSPGGTNLASAGNDGSIILWNADTGEIIARLHGHKGVVSCLAFTPDEEFLISGGWDGKVCVWNSRTGILCRELDEQVGKITQIVVCSDGSTVVAGYQDGTLRFWSLYDGTMVLTLWGHTGSVTALAASKEMILSGGEDGVVKAWSLPWVKPLALATPQDLGSIQSLSTAIVPGADAASREFLEALVRGKVCYDIETESIAYPQGEYDIEIVSESSS